MQAEASTALRVTNASEIEYLMKGPPQGGCRVPTPAAVLEERTVRVDGDAFADSRLTGGELGDDVPRHGDQA